MQASFSLKHFLLALFFALSLLAIGSHSAFASDFADGTTNGLDPQGGLVPCGLTGNLADSCQFCDVVSLIQNIIYFLAFVVAAPLVTIFIAWAGIQMIVKGDDPGARSAAKQILIDALIGFLFILFAWTIVNTIISILVKDKGSSSTWFKIECTNRQAINVDIRTLGAGGGLTTVTQNPTISGNEAVVQAQLAQNNVSVKPGASVAGLNQPAIDYLKTIGASCSGCGVTVTSGTDSHYDSGPGTHGGGDKFDLRLDATGIDKYVTTNFTKGSVRSDGAQLYVDKSTGYVWALETTQGSAPHWDVTVNPAKK